VTTRAQVLDPVQKPKQHYQAKMTGEAMQGPFVQESKKFGKCYITKG